MSAPEDQVPAEFPGYYIINGQKVDPNGNPWRPRRAPEPPPEPSAEAAETADPVTGKKK